MFASNPRNTVFISYSHKDKNYLDRLLVHLRPFERDGLFVAWSDRQIKPGTNWRADIERAIASARVAILLVSADFLASEFISRHELPPLLQTAETAGAVVVPVIVGPCAFDRSPLSPFQAVNDPSKPVRGMEYVRREHVWAQVAKTVMSALELELQQPSRYQSTEELLRLADDMVSGGNLEQAIPLLRQATLQAPTDTSMWLKIATVFKRLKLWEDCLAASDRVLSLDRMNTDALFNRANALYWMGHEEEAHEAVRQAISISTKGQDLHIEVHYGDRPSQASVRVESQFILLAARAGGISEWMIDIVREVIADVKHYGDWLPEEQCLMLRGIWFDDKHGAIVICLDLIHDGSQQPGFDEAFIRQLFHDDYGWYGSQITNVECRIVAANVHSDGFFLTSDEYYDWVRKELFWK